jgi:hypothetical protein
MEPKTNAPPSVDYVLPSRKTADNLLRIYWDIVHPLFPFLNQEQFEEAYEGIWSGRPSESDESLMMCTLNVVFALASQYSENVLSKERETASAKFFDRAQDLLNLDLWGTGSVQLVQCLLLMSQYLQSINSLHQCWMVGGLATRVAEGLGLHLPETSANAPSIQQREHLRRLWHGCILLDRYVLVASTFSCFIQSTFAFDLSNSIIEVRISARLEAHGHLSRFVVRQRLQAINASTHYLTLFLHMHFPRGWTCFIWFPVIARLTPY